MKKTSKAAKTGNGMRAQYDFTDGVRGKYTERYREGTNLVRLDPDVAKVFPDAESVNHALRALLDALPARAARRKSRTA